MRTSWLYLIFLAILIALGIAIGAANSTLVTFDFLLFQTELSLALVMVVGLVVGIIVGLYIALFFCLKVWAKKISVSSELKRIKKENDLIKKHQDIGTNTKKDSK